VSEIRECHSSRHHFAEDLDDKLQCKVMSRLPLKRDFSFLSYHSFNNEKCDESFIITASSLHNIILDLCFYFNVKFSNNNVILLHAETESFLIKLIHFLSSYISECV
jgi:hypothetical protein